MALHPDFPDSPHTILDPDIRWFPADETLRESIYEKLLPPLVHELRKKVKTWRENAYEGATDTSIALLNWWFQTEHLLPKPDGTMEVFEYYFAQREAVETVIYLYDAAGVKDKLPNQGSVGGANCYGGVSFNPRPSPRARDEIPNLSWHLPVFVVKGF